MSDDLGAGASQDTHDGEFHRALGLFDSIMIVSGIMVGSGIFIVSAEITRQVGSAGWLLIVWLITGVLTVAAALSYGELAAMMPRAGGMYVYLREALSPLVGFLYGWTLLTVIQTGTIAAVAIAFARFSGVIFPAISEAHYLVSPINFLPGYAISLSTAQLLALSIILLLTVVNCYGVEWGKVIGNIFTVAKLSGMVLLLLLGAVAFFRAPGILHANFANAWHPVNVTAINAVDATTAFGLFVALCVSQTGALFSADSWHDITFVAGEVHNPKRNLPLSLALGTSMVIVLYLLCNVCYLAVLPLHAIQTAPGDRVATLAVDSVLPRHREDRHGRADYGVHVRHRECDDAGGRPCLLCDGAGRSLFSSRWSPKSQGRPRLGVGPAMLLVALTGPAAHVQPHDTDLREPV